MARASTCKNGLLCVHQRCRRRECSAHGDFVNSQEAATRPCSASDNGGDSEKSTGLLAFIPSISHPHTESPHPFEGFAKPRPSTGSASGRWTFLIASVVIGTSKSGEQGFAYNTASAKVFRHITHHSDNIPGPIGNRPPAYGVGTPRPFDTWPCRGEPSLQYYPPSQRHWRSRWLLFDLSCFSCRQQQPGHRPPTRLYQYRARCRHRTLSCMGRQEENRGHGSAWPFGALDFQ